MRKIILFNICAFTLISCSESVNENAIVGANPYDMLLNLEDQGFSKNKISSEIGTSFEMVKETTELYQKYTTFSKDMKSVETVRVTTHVSKGKSIETGKMFIQFSATMPYHAMNQEAISKWIDSNYNNDKKDTIIGDAKFTIYAPTKFVRMLDIEKVL